MDLSFIEVDPTREDSAPGRYRGRSGFVDFRLLSGQNLPVFAGYLPVTRLGPVRSTRVDPHEEHVMQSLHQSGVVTLPMRTIAYYPFSLGQCASPWEQ